MSTRDKAWPDGSPCWVDLGTSDRAAAWEFYRGVMGWEIFDTGEETGHYGIAMINGRAAAALGQAPPGMPTAWTTYFATSDADATVSAVLAAGGNVILAPGDVGEAGRLAIVQDPTGAVFGLWQAGQMPGAGIVGEPGATVWHDLMTRDPARAREFYTEVFGWTHDRMDGGHDYTTVPGETPDIAMCAIGAMEPGSPAGAPAHWRVYFAVPDTDAAIDAARTGGGQVQMEPWDTPYGRMAILVDPQGASFVILGHTADQR